MYGILDNNWIVTKCLLIIFYCMETNDFIVLYGWREPWEKLQRVLLIPDPGDSESLLPNKYGIPEIGYEDSRGEVVFDVDRDNHEWDVFGVLLRNEKQLQPVENQKFPDNIIDSKYLQHLDRVLIKFLSDKQDLLETLSGEPKLYIWKN